MANGYSFFKHFFHFLSHLTNHSDIEISKIKCIYGYSL